MRTLSVKLPPPLDTALSQASARQHLSKSELVRRAVAAYLSTTPDIPSPRPPSALDLAGDLVGCFGGGPTDLASNPRHLDGFGQR
ncbi:ribbon-helix-helix domain-containing protein [Sphaerotilus sp.]|uniref:ribbon-helix-helix domain-containing protein n=1 Tax=Sphaerotilus sp. TaxID=2093942 RepID=UPI002ACEE35C|nr:ribbon-helix-helix domain-containing protein [Sphaerotilus sp.]MDZ7854843.1 ribbon-helix-helix domain-containing protein [Sphaerotilus sp.]